MKFLAALLFLGGLTLQLLYGSLSKGNRSLASKEGAVAEASIEESSLQEGLILVGKIPGQYLQEAGYKNIKTTTSYLGYVDIQNRIIVRLGRLKSKKLKQFKKENSHRKLIVLKNRNNKNKYDVIYPGLIELHNHTMQNMMPTLSAAKGQFRNRYEWKSYEPYKRALKNNVNTWLKVGGFPKCVGYRWSEVQAMTLGTTYMQGPHRDNCVKNFAIHHVEDPNAYISQKKKVSAPSDLFTMGKEEDTAYLWHEMREKIIGERRGGQFSRSYEDVLIETIHNSCPSLKDKINHENLYQRGLLSSKKRELENLCPKSPPGFIPFLVNTHAQVAKRKAYLQNPNASAFIVHLSEGRRNDPYTQLEFELLVLLGLDNEKVNLVHAMGLENPMHIFNGRKTGYEHMAEKGVGLIWSPYSNLLLYGETSDLKAIKEAGVTVALGSDWTPTGTKGLLEEVKIARNYIYKMGLQGIYTDRELYKMMTENPAKMINHFAESPVVRGEHGIGTLKEGAMGTVIVASQRHSNPYTNLVARVWGEDVNLVVVDGQPIYGNRDYFTEYGQRERLEVLSQAYTGDAEIKISEEYNLKFPTSVKGEAKAVKAQKEKEWFFEVTAAALSMELIPVNKGCRFSQSNPKVFAPKNSLEINRMKYSSKLDSEESLSEFYEKTGFNYDRVYDLRRFLSLGIYHLSTNAQSIKKKDFSGDPKYRPDYFPPLYSCYDQGYRKRLMGFIDKNPENTRDEYSRNLRDRTKNAIQSKRFNDINERYGLPFD